MIRLLRQWWQRRRELQRVDELRWEMASEWEIVEVRKEYNGQKNDRDSWAVRASYALEQNGLGDRRIRIIWRAYSGYRLASESYVEALAWAEQRGSSKPIKEMA